MKPVSPAVLRAVIASLWGDAEIRSRVATLHNERDELLQSLLETNLRLQEYDQERTNFLARAIHDFRAPLTALNGYCGLLMTEEMGSLSPDQIEVLQRMQDSAKRLTRMTSAMFELSIKQRLETPANFQVGDIRAVLCQTLNEVRPLFSERRIKVTVDIVDPEVALTFERAQIDQVILNLLDNASKFTPRGGSVTIHAYPYFWERRTRFAGPMVTQRDRRTSEMIASNAYRIDVRDSGRGVPPEMLETIFEEYTTGTGASDRSGGGLGLAICRMILQRHAGRIWAENSAEGPMFSFVLPYRSTDRISVVMPSPERYLQAVAGGANGG